MGLMITSIFGNVPNVDLKAVYPKIISVGKKRKTNSGYTYKSQKCTLLGFFTIKFTSGFGFNNSYSTHSRGIISLCNQDYLLFFYTFVLSIGNTIKSLTILKAYKHWSEDKRDILNACKSGIREVRHWILTI